METQIPHLPRRHPRLVPPQVFINKLGRLGVFARFRRLSPALPGLLIEGLVAAAHQSTVLPTAISPDSHSESQTEISKNAVSHRVIGTILRMLSERHWVSLPLLHGAMCAGLITVTLWFGR